MEMHSPHPTPKTKPKTQCIYYTELTRKVGYCIELNKGGVHHIQVEEGTGIFIEPIKKTGLANLSG